MVIIRLSRGGSKKHPFYKIIVADRRNKRDGRYLEKLGFFNPIAAGTGDDIRLKLSKDRVDYWISKGAQLSPRVKSLLKEYDKLVTT